MSMQSRFAWKKNSRMISRRLLMKAGAVPLAALAGGSAYGVLRAQAGRYALPGASIGSVDISGLSVAEANARVTAQWSDYIKSPVELRSRRYYVDALGRGNRDYRRY